MHTATIDSLLEYEVYTPSHFLFNIEAAFHDGHTILEERLSITPSVKVRTFRDERNGNRFVRLDAPKGVLSVNYHAKIELTPMAVPLHLDETPVSNVPDDVRAFRAAIRGPSIFKSMSTPSLAAEAVVDVASFRNAAMRVIQPRDIERALDGDTCSSSGASRYVGSKPTQPTFRSAIFVNTQQPHDW